MSNKWKVGYYKLEGEAGWEFPNQIMLPIKSHVVRPPNANQQGLQSPLVESLGQTLELRANQTYWVDERLAKQLLKVVATMPGIQSLLAKNAIQVYDHEGFYQIPDADIPEQDLTDLEPMTFVNPVAPDKPKENQVLPIKPPPKSKVRSKK